MVALLLTAGAACVGMGTLFWRADPDPARPVQALDPCPGALEFVFHRTLPAEVHGDTRTPSGRIYVLHSSPELVSPAESDETLFITLLDYP
jgi:hypothetical protein